MEENNKSLEEIKKKEGDDCINKSIDKIANVLYDSGFTCFDSEVKIKENILELCKNLKSCKSNDSTTITSGNITVMSFGNRYDIYLSIGAIGKHTIGS
jgi:hypothetical protein